MTPLEKVFESYYETQTDNEEIQDAWHKMELYLYENCTETIHEQISTLALEFTRKAEKQAFIDGFMQSVQLIIDIYNT